MEAKQYWKELGAVEKEAMKVKQMFSQTRIFVSH